MKKTFLLLFSILLFAGTAFTINSCQPDIPEVTDGKDGNPGKDGQDGQDGTAGLSVVFDFRDATLEQCPSGGTSLVFAYDTNFNKAFDENDQMINQIPICNGSDGINCWDFNQNGKADPSEDINGDGTVDVDDCGSGQVVYNIVAIPEGQTECGGAGGWRVSFGVDEDKDKLLDPDEVRDTFTVCNGKDGNDGLDGIVAMGVVISTQTTNGCTTITFYYDNGALPGRPDEADTPIDSVVICDGSEGGSGQACWDLNGNGVGDTSEDLNGDGAVDILDCRGADGSNGGSGTDGSTPLVTFTSTTFTSNSQCPDGGVTIRILVDGVQNTSFDVCNGTGTQSYIVYSILQDPEQCGDKGGVQVDVYEDIDGNGAVDPNVDFFFESFTICIGMNAAQVLAIGYGLDDYVDIDIQVVNGADSCPSDPNSSHITAYIENDFLIEFDLCNKNYLPDFQITGVTISNITTTSFRVTTTTDTPVKLKIQYGTVSGVYQWETTFETNLLTSHSQTVGGGNPIQLTPGTQYFWRVYAEDEAGIGGYSGERTTTTTQ